MEKFVWLLGAGRMAQDYAKVLSAMDYNSLVIGRGKSSAQAFEAATGQRVIYGGLREFLESKPVCPDAAIVAVGVESLAAIAEELLNFGVRRILLEKPGALDRLSLLRLHNLALSLGAEIFIAYNRRFYASVLEALRWIERDGGVKSFHFEFTEWGHVIGALDKSQKIKESWFLANSTHVVDMAFFLGGTPQVLNSLQGGKLPWHTRASRFVGAGVAENDALFSYCANWSSPGRWGVEIMTENFRLIFTPLEELRVMHKGEVHLEDVIIDNQLDKDFKPGLYRQIEEFLSKSGEHLCSLEKQLSMWSFYERMAGYS